MRLLPRLDPINREFWTAGARGELRILQCLDCEGFVHPPRPVCRHCLSERLATKVVSGQGVIDTYTINHQPWHPAMAVPFVVARVALNDAPEVYLTTNIVGCAVEEVEIGDRVRVIFEQREDVYLPLFEKMDRT